MPLVVQATNPNAVVANLLPCRGQGRPTEAWCETVLGSHAYTDHERWTELTLARIAYYGEQLVPSRARARTRLGGDTVKGLIV